MKDAVVLSSIFFTLCFPSFAQDTDQMEPPRTEEASEQQQVGGSEAQMGVYAWTKIDAEELRTFSDDTQLLESCVNLPDTLYLSMSKNKEWPPLYRHAWGEARISSRADMGDLFPVSRLLFRVEMPAIGTPIIDERTCVNAATCSADSKYAGTIFGSFTATWFAQAEHPCFGRWSSGPERW